MILFCILHLCNTSSYGQVLAGVKESFTRYAQNTPREKIYVHTDKQLYLAGEILWFKIYDVDGDTNKPSALSKVAYTEILDQNNDPVLQAKIALNNGSGSGSFYLPVSVNTSNYRLRVYTSWMKNFSADNYFQKTISIVNPLKSPEKPNKPIAENYDIQFFAEGGYLLNNVSSKVAFRVVDAKGSGVQFTGAIVNEHNDTIAKIKPLQFGIGNFTFKPSRGHTYTAIIRINGKVEKKELPVAMDQGYNMAVTGRSGGQIHIRVNSTDQSAQVIYLLANTRQQLKDALSAPMANGVADLVVDESKLGEGVSRLTIFNSAQQPVCERSVFKRPQVLSVGATADKPGYQTRKKVNIQVSVTDKSGRPLATDMSVSIYRADSLQGNVSGSIQSYLWLTADLKGNIEAPDSYFDPNNTNADEAIDNLMLTQGWTGFKWEDVLNGKAPVFKYIPEYSGHIITAKVTDPKTGLPAKNTIINLSVPGKRVQFYPATTNASGYVYFNTKNFYGANELVVQPNFASDSSLKIEVIDPYAHQFTDVALPHLHLNKNYSGLLQRYSVNTQAQNIYHGDQIRPFYAPAVDSSSFFGQPKKTYLLDDYTRFTTMEEVLREYVHEVFVSKSQKRFHFRVVGSEVVLRDDPLVLLDGIPITDMNKVIALDPLKVKRLDVVNEHYFLRPLICDGILSFSTYKGDLGGYEIDPHAVVLDHEGMQLKRDFFSPVYDSPEQINDHLPDLRSVLYWQPNITTDNTGKATVSFYTSDVTGSYIGILQGITADGMAGSGSLKIEVK